MPTDEEYRLLYELNYFSGADVGDAPGWLRDYPAVAYEEALTPVRLEAYRARLRRLQKVFPSRGTLLDVGMATGEFAAMAAADGWRVCGLDVSAEACRRAAEWGIEAHCGDLGAGGLQGRHFDVVHLHHVFEHFTDPRAALARLASFLDRDSLLVMEVPSQFDSWTRRLVNGVRLATGRTTPRSVLSIHHPYFYSGETITALVRTQQELALVWLRTYFPERWSGPAYRQVLRLIDFVADRLGHHGENIEIAVRIRPHQER